MGKFGYEGTVRGTMRGTMRTSMRRSMRGTMRGKRKRGNNKENKKGNKSCSPEAESKTKLQRDENRELFRYLNCGSKLQYTGLNTKLTMQGKVWNVSGIMGAVQCK